MRIEFLDSVSSDERIVADICLVGSGPAALTIARELGDKNIRIAIVESGGMADNFAPQSSFENIGEPRIAELSLVRNRIFGGTSHQWSGRCAMFDSIDFQHRSWVPMSGWPIDLAEMSPFVTRASKYIGIGAYLEEAFEKTYGGPRSNEFPGVSSPLSVFFWTFSRDQSDQFEHMRFGPAFLKTAQKNVEVFLHATATHINTTDNGLSVTGLEVTDRNGRRFEVEAPLVVLCCGGIENPRLLLASNRVTPTGLGNSRDMVGRYLMDHPKCIIADFDPVAAESLRESYSFFRLESGAVVAAGFALSAATQEREKLLNCAAWLDEDRAADDPWDAIKRLRRPGPAGRKMTDVWAVLADPNLLLRGARRIFERRGVPHKLNRLFLSAIVEQVPDPESRLTLLPQRDAFGVPLPRIDWRISQLERKSVSRLAELIETEISKLGFARPSRILDPKFLDAAHPSGTTRMAEDQFNGVVDKNCAVHGVRGLYVAGSSVFPTAGHANPTLLIVSMAVRLADHLRLRLQEGVTSIVA